jgi:hypothetical protein
VANYRIPAHLLISADSPQEALVAAREFAEDLNLAEDETVKTIEIREDIEPEPIDEEEDDDVRSH